MTNANVMIIELEVKKCLVEHVLGFWCLFQLWTVYLEQLGGGGTGSGAGAADGSVSSGETIVLEFWGKVTPGILQLLSLSKSVSSLI